MYVQYRSNALVNCYVQIRALHVQCDMGGCCSSDGMVIPRLSDNQHTGSSCDYIDYRTQTTYVHNVYALVIISVTIPHR